MEMKIEKTDIDELTNLKRKYVIYKASIALLVIVSFIFVSCSRERAEQDPRTKISALNNKVFSIPELSKFSGPLDSTESNSCDRLNELAEKTVDARRYFQMFSELDLAEFTGKVSLAHNPFLQVILLKKIKIPSTEDMLEIIRTKQKDGEISKLKGHLGRCASNLYDSNQDAIGFWETLCKSVGPTLAYLSNGSSKSMSKELMMNPVYETANQMTLAGFPGIFSEKSPIDKSLYLSLLVKSLMFNGSDESAKHTTKTGIPPIPPETVKILTAKLPLFTNASWEINAQDSYKDLTAAKNGFYSRQNPDEKVCSLVLYHRAFSQLLAINGHLRPQFASEDTVDDNSHLEKFSKENPALIPTPVIGSFIKLADGTPHIPTPEELASYDPKKGVLLPAIESPISPINQPSKNNPANLTELLSHLELLTAHYVATSPAENWIKSPKQYILGDIADLQSLASIPSLYHNLSLGLITFHFKNLAGLFLKKVNAENKIKKDNEDTAGLLLANPSEFKNELAQVSLENILSFTRLSLNLGLSLEKLILTSASKLEKMNSLYTKETLKKLAGPDESSLLNTLKAAQPALAFLLLKYIDEKGACFSTIHWDLKSGEQKLERPCDGKIKTSFRKILGQLGERLESPVLLLRSRQIR